MQQNFITVGDTDDHRRADLRIQHDAAVGAVQHAFFGIGLQGGAAAAAETMAIVPVVQMKAHQTGVGVMAGL